MFRHPPVFRFDPISGGTVISSLYQINSGNLWEDLISFNPLAILQDIYEENHPGNIITPEIMSEMYRLNIWARTGRPLENVSPQIYNDEVVPFGSVLDFAIIQIEMQSDEALIIWLQFRKLHFKSTISTDAERHALEAVVNRCNALGNSGPPISNISNTV